MKLDGVLTETGAGDQNEVDSVKSFMAAHPNLKGLIGIAPTEAYMAAEAITQAGRIGQVFSAGNGGDGLERPPAPGYVRTGAAELVYASNPITQGYLTVWAANYLLTGHHFRPGAYQVGGPIGRVWYYAKHRELRAASRSPSRRRTSTGTRTSSNGRDLRKLLRRAESQASAARRNAAGVPTRNRDSRTGLNRAQPSLPTRLLRS